MSHEVRYPEITRDASNKNIKSSSNGQGFASDVENQVTTKTNVDLTKEQKDRDITGKCNFLFNNCNANCGQFAEFEEADGCLYEKSNYKYQMKKAGNSNLNIKMKSKK